jgi:HipA-like C-terminal domain
MNRSGTDLRWEQLRHRLLAGPARADEACAAIGASPATLSRLVKTWRDQLIVIGRARATRYIGAREILDVGASVELTEVMPDGSARRIGTLHGALPEAFFFEPRLPGTPEGYFQDLPYFLHDLRPAGFLGRLVPRQHPELHFHADIQNWTADNTVAYCSRFGSDLPGNVILGDIAFQRHLARTQETSYVSDADRQFLYPSMAENVLSIGEPGSSAGGEQAKFLVNRSADGKAALVKFSPPRDGSASERIADLLVAEHIALATMRQHGHDAAKSELVVSADRVFLENERFDRLPNHGRRGVISLFALDAQFVGGSGQWIDSTRALASAGVIATDVLPLVRWRQRFGSLIGNSDMHSGNLSFFTEGLCPVGLTPTYDMGPARYAPRQGELSTVTRLQAPIPEPDDGKIWATVCRAAEQFWEAVSQHDLITPSFRAIAKDNVAVVHAAARFSARLP